MSQEQLRMTLQAIRDRIGQKGGFVYFPKQLVHEVHAALAAQGEPMTDEQIEMDIWPELTDQMIDAADGYLRRFPHWHGLPALFRWHEIWDAMLAAAPKEGVKK